jgi:hypothetical protein
MTVDYPAVLMALYPGAEWTLNGDDYAGLTWLDDSPKPTKKALENAWPSVRDDLAWGRVRAERDRLLTACDWTQVADAPLTADEKQAWADYRQALRDVPQTFDSPEDVVWPEAP